MKETELKPMSMEEAINIISVLKSRISNKKNIEAFELAINAMKKRLSEKVNETVCPVCKERLVNYLDRVFCPYCGQALDWNDSPTEKGGEG